jgi:hypothetical protein
MKKTNVLLTLFTLLSLSFVPKPDTRLYELRTYYAENGKMDALVQQFKDHTTKLYEKHGMTNVGYWVASADSNKLLCALSYPNRTARDASWKAFNNDPKWKNAAEKAGKLVTKVDSTFMTVTDYSPKLKKKNIGKEERVFELRTYYMQPGRVPAIMARFRNHTMKLFENHGMTNMVYWTTIENDGSQPKLVYILAHKSEEAGKASFGTFVKDPEWIRVRDDSEKDGKILEKIESVYMKATGFSKMR